MTKPKIKQKNPSVLLQSDGLTDYQRRALNLPKVAPRKRMENEATSRLLCAGTVKGHYRYGDGDTLTVMRPGSEIAAGLPSLGIGA